jgi:hypothetical protein
LEQGIRTGRAPIPLTQDTTHRIVGPIDVFTGPRIQG